jgi:hypothetical protein
MKYVSSHMSRIHFYAVTTGKNGNGEQCFLSNINIPEHADVTIFLYFSVFTVSEAQRGEEKSKNNP